MATIYHSQDKAQPIRLLIDKKNFSLERGIIDSVKTSIPSRKRSYDPVTHIWRFDADQLPVLLMISYRIRGAGNVWFYNNSDDETYIQKGGASYIENLDVMSSEFRFCYIKPDPLVLAKFGATLNTVPPPAQGGASNTPNWVEISARIQHVERRAGMFRLLTRIDGKIEVFKCSPRIFEASFKPNLDKQIAAAKKLLIHTDNYYKTLGVSQTAQASEIKASWREKIKFLHPDTCKLENATDAFRAVQEAYEVLIDEQKRRLYNFSLKIAGGSNASKPIVLQKPIEGVDYRYFRVVNVFDAKMKVDMLSKEVAGVISLDLVYAGGALITSLFNLGQGATMMSYSGNVASDFDAYSF